VRVGAPHPRRVGINSGRRSRATGPVSVGGTAYFVTAAALLHDSDGGDVVVGDSIRPGKPRLWSEGRYLSQGPNRMFDLHRDGNRFAFAPNEQVETGGKRDRVTFLLNFSDELRRKAPGSQ
jgi:hypothetical protein